MLILPDLAAYMEEKMVLKCSVLQITNDLLMLCIIINNK